MQVSELSPIRAFRASKKQLCLHTGVAYFKERNKVKNECFATVSDNVDHQAHAVWGHMTPILQKYSSRFPKITRIHFFSDGPSSQYRNRFNLKLFQQIVPKHFRYVKTMTWNFTEAGHGKGPMDGVGGTLKRQADWKVLYGTDIKTAADFVSALKDTDISLEEVSPAQIDNFRQQITSMKVPAVKGIMNVHQETYSQGVMYARSLSCFDCPASQYCEHYSLFKFFPNEWSYESEEEEVFQSTSKWNLKRFTVDEVYSSSEDDAERDGIEFGDVGNLPDLDPPDLNSRMSRKNTNH